MTLPANISDKIKRLKSQQISEADTKRAIIDPILSALGWDTSDVIEVKNEYRKQPQDNPVDYAIFIGNRPVLFIEAKSLHAGIEDRKAICQALAYANTCGVEWCVLTDGDNWRIYNAHAPVDADEKEFRRTQITEGKNIDALDMISKASFKGPILKLTWDLEFNGKRTLTLLTRLFQNCDPTLLKLIKKEDPHLDREAIKNVLPTITLALDGTTKKTNPAQTSSWQPQPKPTTPAKKGKDVTKIKLIDLLKAGKIVAGTKLTARPPKKGGEYPEGTMNADGTITVEGRSFSSPSSAGAFARHCLHQKGTPKDYPTDGYQFWLFNGKRLDEARKEIAG